ncbi:LemA family protein [Guggenheimella bovis]
MIVIAIVLILLVGYIAITFNKLQRVKTRVKMQWAHVDEELKRRSSLIPPLVEVVKGYEGFEKATLEKLTEIKRMMEAGDLEKGVIASERLKETISFESYPELKTSEVFLKLQKELSETEQQIAVMRSFYNTTVKKYNIEVESFPQSIVAKLFGFHTIPFLEIN